MSFKVFDATHTAIDVESTVNGDGNHVPHHYRGMSDSVLHGQGVAGSPASSLGSGSVRSGLVIRCLIDSPEPLYVGTSGVTTSTGYPVHPGQTCPKLEVDDLGSLYVTSAAGTATYAFVGT